MCASTPIEDIQGIKVAIKGGGTCIYCGSDGGDGGLHDEHIVPYSLGGKTVLLQASCSDCEKITSYLDGYLANATYKFLRVHSGVQSRSGHPDSLQVRIETAKGREVLDLSPKNHPYFLHMPIWGPPGIMRGLQPSPLFPAAKAHVYWWVPPSFHEIVGLHAGDLIKIQDTTPMPNLNPFARAIAKIAYCEAIRKYGLNGIRSLVMPDLILGKYTQISHFVGSDWNDPPPPEKSHVLHVVTHTNVQIGCLKYVTVRLRLFAHSGTAENGMPFYEVVVGTLGHPKAISRRPSPKLPRVIFL